MNTDRLPRTAVGLLHNCDFKLLPYGMESPRVNYRKLDYGYAHSNGLSVDDTLTSDKNVEKSSKCSKSLKIICTISVITFFASSLMLYCYYQGFFSDVEIHTSIIATLKEKTLKIWHWSKHLDNSQAKKDVGKCNHPEVSEMVKEAIMNVKKEERVIQLGDQETFIEDECQTNLLAVKRMVEPSQQIVHGSGYRERFFYSDTIPDYALESAGAQILETIDTEQYGDLERKLVLFGKVWLTIPNFFLGVNHPNGPGNVIKPWRSPGECWSFKGSRGAVRIKLSHMIAIEAVTLEHVPVSLSPELNIDSAPRVFSIIGLNEGRRDWTRRLLGTFEFDQDGPSVQMFKMTSKEALFPYQVIELRIESNQGHRNYLPLSEVIPSDYSFSEDPGFLNMIPGDESWVCGYDPETKRYLQWKHPKAAKSATK